MTPTRATHPTVPFTPRVTVDIDAVKRLAQHDADAQAAIQRAQDKAENATWLYRILQQPITWKEG